MISKCQSYQGKDGIAVTRNRNVKSYDRVVGYYIHLPHQHTPLCIERDLFGRVEYEERLVDITSSLSLCFLFKYVAHKSSN
jgi:hypothetical protein